MIITLGVDRRADAAHAHAAGARVVHQPELAQRFGLTRPRYEGITGIVGVLHAELDARGIPAISMQVGVPHYAAGTPNPKAAMALLRNLEHVTGIPTGHTALTEEAHQWERMVDDAIAENPEASAYIPSSKHATTAGRGADAVVGRPRRGVRALPARAPTSLADT